MKQTTRDSATMVLHELRAPLGLMATAARSAADDCQDADLRSRCEMIVRAAEGMLRTADQVFQLNRAAQAETREFFLPAGVAAEVAAMLGAFGVRVEFEACSASTEAECFGVRERFEALVHSLLSNAVDHAEPGTSIRLRLWTCDGLLNVQVSNRAARQAHHHGLGLGISIADALAERLGGTLERCQAGNTFRATLRLPINAL